MLIIAIPKSASSAILATLREIHNLPAQQVFFPELPLPQNMRILWKYHSDVREISTDLANKFMDTDAIFKQHLPPTPNNIELLQDCRKVILLREPQDIILAYRRARRSLISGQIDGFGMLGSKQDWLSRAKENGLYEDLEDFIDIWTHKSGDKRLVIWYHELINNPTRAVRDIERFWEIPITQMPVVLSQRRYSRTGTVIFKNATVGCLKRLGLLGVAQKLYRLTKDNFTK